MPWQMWTITAALPDFSRPPPLGCYFKIEDDACDNKFAMMMTDLPIFTKCKKKGLPINGQKLAQPT